MGPMKSLAACGGFMRWSSCQVKMLAAVAVSRGRLMWEG